MAKVLPAGEMGRMAADTVALMEDRTVKAVVVEVCGLELPLNREACSTDFASTAGTGHTQVHLGCD